MGDSMDLKQRLEQLHPELVSLRRDFHRHPELGFQEFRTQKKIIDYLENIGIKARKSAGTGVVGVLPGRETGRTILLRSDMDALPVQEETGLAFKSANAGVMHACGHDGHMAMLLIAAKLLAARRAEINGTVVFAFQPNEEDAGAWKMIEEKVIESQGVEAAFGCHLWNSIDTGIIDIREGPIMAASHYFTLTVRGKGGHAGFAHASIDPILAASHVIQAVQAIQTRQIDALDPAVVMFTRIQGGMNTTIIPESVVLQGSIRFLYDGGDAVLEKFEHTARAVCRLHGAACDLSFKMGNPMLSNDTGMARVARKAATAVVADADRVTAAVQTMAGEDFAEFARRVPSAFAFVGARRPAAYENHPHHHPKFDIDEAALLVGAELYARVAMEYLREEAL